MKRNFRKILSALLALTMLVSFMSIPVFAETKIYEVKVRTLPGWLLTVIVVLIIVCLISLAFKVVSLLLPLLLSSLLYG